MSYTVAEALEKCEQMSEAETASFNNQESGYYVAKFSYGSGGINVGDLLSAMQSFSSSQWASAEGTYSSQGFALTADRGTRPCGPTSGN